MSKVPLRAGSPPRSGLAVLRPRVAHTSRRLAICTRAADTRRRPRSTALLHAAPDTARSVSTCSSANTLITGEVARPGLDESRAPPDDARQSAQHHGPQHGTTHAGQRPVAHPEPPHPVCAPGNRRHRDHEHADDQCHGQHRSRQRTQLSSLSNLQPGRVRGDHDKSPSLLPSRGRLEPAAQVHSVPVRRRLRSGDAALSLPTRRDSNHSSRIDANAGCPRLRASVDRCAAQRSGDLDLLI